MDELVTSWNEIGQAIYGKADAQRVADEIEAIGEAATPAQIVEAAKNENSELHKCFDWNDTEAAEKWRLHQARDVVRCLVIRREVKEGPPQEVRVFHKVDSCGYKPITRIFRNEDEYANLLQRAYADLQVFKKKYANLQELDAILELIP